MGNERPVSAYFCIVFRDMWVISHVQGNAGDMGGQERVFGMAGPWVGIRLIPDLGVQ